ncbi:MAG: hypothetical protein AAF243_07230 [Cyanobacteria bacterium P01_A01_bin.137]
MASSPDNPSAAIPPRTGSGSTPEIEPQLENVLRNLNVNLEDELTRYRRQRHGRVPPPPPPRRSAQRHTIDLISVPASSEGSGVTPDAPSPRPVPPPPPPNPFLNQSSESGNEPSDPDQEAGLLSDLSGLDEIAADLEPPSDSDPNMALPVHASDTPTEEYLESSQELLKSIADDQAEPDSIPEPYSPERKNNGLLKLAGLILVLLGGVGVGFAITYPSQLQKLRSQLWPAGNETADTDTTETTAGETPAGTAAPEATANIPDAPSETAPDGYKPPGPDLSTREFKELDLESLSTLDVDSAGGPAAATPPLTNPAQTPIPAAAPAGQPASPDSTTSPAASPSAAASAPASAPLPAPVAVAPSPAPAAATGSNFYVIASYTGDDSLNKARELVPDAFVRNFQAGARIQLAAFDNQAQAEDQVAALTQQGATVELFGPTNE